jgi:Fe-S-cluster containining protein
MAEAEFPETDVIQNTPRLGPDDRFTFHCDPSLDCFGHCCQDVSILLTPYDVLRMKKALGINSSEFMEQYTSIAYSAEKRVPVVFLKMNEDDKKCQFVSEKGCGVYANRPWACRMYPLGMAERGTSQAAIERFYFVLKEELCHGHAKGSKCAVREFIDGQGVEPYDVMQIPFRRLLAVAAEHKEPLTTEQCAMYYMALYDIDRFRRFVFETRFLKLFDVDEARVHALRTDDEELLELAVEWLAFSLFQQKAMRMNKSAAQQQRAPGSAACTNEASPA